MFPEGECPEPTRSPVRAVDRRRLSCLLESFSRAAASLGSPSCPAPTSGGTATRWGC